MAQTQLTASDGVTIGAYEARPASAAKGGVVVIQEIFGVNQHIREVVDGYADAGYVAIAPQIFDRIEPNIELGYEGADMERGIGLAFNQLDRAATMLDIQAAIDAAGVYGKVGVVGYCFGGLLTWLSACELSGVAAVSAYYGGGIAGELERQARVPVMMHFGDQDAHIPVSDVDKIRAAQPAATVHLYEADHGFNCNHRGSFNQAAATTAAQRTHAFFGEHLAK